MATKKTSTKTKSDPFKIKKSRETAAKTQELNDVPDEVKQAIDRYKEAKTQEKQYKSEADGHKLVISEYAEEKFCERAYSGTATSFTLLGKMASTTFVAVNGSSSITEDERDQIADEFGEKAAEELLTKDFKSLRFNENVLAENYDAVVSALQTLPEEVLENLFTEMTYKVTDNILTKARTHAKNPAHYGELIRALKVKNYVR